MDVQETTTAVEEEGKHTGHAHYCTATNPHEMTQQFVFTDHAQESVQKLRYCKSTLKLHFSVHAYMRTSGHSLPA